ncbi:hypothetical protein Mapa_016754 [Marchantia paleacea]|nr:hypothetical protein Mapa_016754 [Marchantia paleacea]
MFSDLLILEQQPFKLDRPSTPDQILRRNARSLDSCANQTASCDVYSPGETYRNVRKLDQKNHCQKNHYHQPIDKPNIHEHQKKHSSISKPISPEA